MKIDANDSQKQLMYLGNRPDKLHPELPIHRIVASALPQHFGEKADKKSIELTGYQPMIDEMKKVITKAIEKEGTTEEGHVHPLSECLNRTTIFEALIWPDKESDEEETGKLQVGIFAGHTEAASVKEIQQDARAFARRMIRECDGHDTTSLIPENIVGVGITTFTSLKNRPVDFKIYRTFLTVNHQWVSFKFNVYAKNDFSFSVSMPKKIHKYPWHAHMLSDALLGTFNRVFNYKNN